MSSPTVQDTCCVCGGPLTGMWTYHQRLGVYVCETCPKTNVMGEDITMHTVYWGKGDSNE